MITRRSLFGLTFGGAVTGATGIKAIDQPGPVPLPTKNSPPAQPPMRLTIGAHGHACKVEIGGVDVTRLCQAAYISAKAGDVTTLHLEMLVREGSEITVEPGHVDLEVRNLQKRLRFAFDRVRVKADV